MTNAEKIRQLTDEELACYLTRIQISSVLDFFADNFGEIAPPREETRKELQEAILKVLQQEVVDD